MAGMLAGVECARRRRFHQSGGSLDSPTTTYGSGFTRRSFYCLYTTSHESQITSNPSMERRVMNQMKDQDENLEEVAREAKERLHGRLRAQRKSGSKRTNSRETLRGLESREEILKEEDLQFGVFESKTKKSGSKRFGWSRLGAKASVKEECAVGLEPLHARRLLPWLQTSAYCPCCRMAILSNQ